MAALLEFAAPVSAVAPISVALYEERGELVNGRRTELIRGVIVKKMSISPLHASLVTRLRRLVLAAIGPAEVCREEKPLRLADSEPEPDLAVIAGREEDYFQAHPATALLAVEVAVSSLTQDRAKAILYAEAGVPEYWIVLADDEAVEVFTAPQASRYSQRRVYRKNETLNSVALPALRVDLAALFAVT